MVLPIPCESVASMENDCCKIFRTTCPISDGNFSIPNFSCEEIFESVPAKSEMAVCNATVVCGRKPSVVIPPRRCIPSVSLVGRCGATGCTPTAPAFIGIFSTPIKTIQFEYFFLTYFDTAHKFFCESA